MNTNKSNHANHGGLKLNRLDYLEELERILRAKLSRAEVDDILRDYAEYFEEGLKQGQSEPEIASRLGLPQEVARQIIAESYVDRAGKRPTVRNFFKMRGMVRFYSAGAFLLSIPLMAGAAGITIALGLAFLLLILLSLVIFTGMFFLLPAIPPTAAALGLLTAAAALLAAITVLLLTVCLTRSFVRWMGGIFAGFISRTPKNAQSGGAGRETDPDEMAEEGGETPHA